MNRHKQDETAWAEFSKQPVTVLVSPHSSEVERYAGKELRKYLTLLYGCDISLQLDAVERPNSPYIVVGHPQNYHFLADLGLPALASDGFWLKTVSDDPTALLIAGATGRGTLFGAYEFIERCGVQFLLSGDLLPEFPEPLCLTGFDERIEPAYPIRALRPLNNLPEGSASWDLPDFTSFIDQMAKLKFNTYVFAIMESGPWLDYSYRGLERPAGDIFYGYRYPIDARFVGRQQFEGQTEFYSPVLGRATSDAERKRLGIELVRAVIAHCKSRGLQVILTFNLLEPPTAFKWKCNDWTSQPLPDPKHFAGAEFDMTPVEEFGVNPLYAAWMNVADPMVRELAALRLKALIETYPDVDMYHLWVSEHRAGVVDHHAILEGLDKKYALLPGFNFEDQLEAWHDSPWGRGRYQNQMKGDLLFLSAFDTIFNEGRLLEQSSRPEANIGIGGVMPQLAPLVTKVMPPGSVFVEFLDYGVHGPADAINDLVGLLKDDIPITLEIGIHDDNDMYFPQVSVESLETIVAATSPYSMKGYVAALWQVRQSDINAAYLARASWKPETTATQFYEDFLPKLVGPAAAGDFERAMRLIEKADREVRAGALYGYAFLMNDRLIEKFIRYGVDRLAASRVWSLFRAASEMFADALQTASVQGKLYTRFWLTRTQFAMQWLDMAACCDDLGKLPGEVLNEDIPLTEEEKQAMVSAIDCLLAQSESLINLIVQDAGHNGDLGQIAGMNRHMHRYFLDLRTVVTARAVVPAIAETMPYLEGAEEAAPESIVNETLQLVR